MSRMFCLVVAVVLAVTLGAVALRSADASCRSSRDRIPHAQADCVHTWTSGNVFHTRIGAQHLCPELGKAVVKWDLRAQKDRTWTLSTSAKRRARVVAIVNGAYCCRDLGVCRRADVVNHDSCWKRFAESAAASRCTRVAIEARSATHCAVKGFCRPGPGPRTVWVDTELRYLKTRHAVVCEDGLKVLRCSVPGRSGRRR